MGAVGPALSISSYQGGGIRKQTGSRVLTAARAGRGDCVGRRVEQMVSPPALGKKPEWAPEGLAGSDEL